MNHDDKLKKSGNQINDGISWAVFGVVAFFVAFIVFLIFGTRPIAEFIVGVPPHNAWGRDNKERKETLPTPKLSVEEQFVKDNQLLVNILDIRFAEGKCWIVVEGYIHKTRKIITIDSQSSIVPLPGETWEIRTQKRESRYGEEVVTIYFLTRQQSYEKKKDEPPCDCRNPSRKIDLFPTRLNYLWSTSDE